TLLGASATTVTFQIGDTASINDQFVVALSGATTTFLSISGLDLSNMADAQTAMTALDSALTSINTIMGNVGGMQNQLQYAVSNLTTTIQNYTSSASTIEDVDMASAVSDMTKQQILEQSAMAMLAQANQDPQQILKLLQG
ncbi:MAG: flagellin, partial [Syntrophobacteraceae bacterium]